MPKTKRNLIWLWIGIAVIVGLMIGGVVGILFLIPKETRVLSTDSESFLVEDVSFLAFRNLPDICYHKFNEETGMSAISGYLYLFCYAEFSGRNVYQCASGFCANIACNCYGSNHYLKS